jgi:hypothetical protein
LQSFQTLIFKNHIYIEFVLKSLFSRTARFCLDP